MLHPISWSLALPYYSAAFVFGYLLGSIPFGLILTRLAGTADLRTIGSGNIGATNVLRTGRKGLAALTLLCDALKGTLAAAIAYRYGGQDLAVLAALGAFLGHLFPVWLRFKGGKGVATYLGLLVFFFWPAALAFAVIWLAVAAATRYSSAAALAASGATPIILWQAGYLQEAQLFALFTALLWLKHAGNVRRLVAGREGKIGRGRQADDTLG
ncbi:MAG TPA: glycerol-3-phosphate 1-O-acyltransferase PlsY [Rhodoplanes sp.]|nr:glycerol-3-phosphate 1-O-acyltransferase PlsY [Rhodoplanes sp.]